MSRIVFRKQARAEFDEAGDWYEHEHRGLGLEFMAEIDRVLARIATGAQQFPRAHGVIRKPVVRRFPYCVYFRVREDRIVVLAVFHTARDPDVWKRRR